MFPLFKVNVKGICMQYKNELGISVKLEVQYGLYFEISFIFVQKDLISTKFVDNETKLVFFQQWYVLSNVTNLYKKNEAFVTGTHKLLVDKLEAPKFKLGRLECRFGN